ncbi:MAG: helix-turn-helix domain-containing protein [Edaphobacter sp.]
MNTETNNNAASSEVAIPPTVQTFTSPTARIVHTFNAPTALSDRITVSVEEAMTALGIGRTMMYELINDETIASITVGKKRLIIVASIYEWLTDQLNYQASGEGN